MSPTDARISAATAPPRHDLLSGVHPARGLAFIRRIETEETYAGGRILVTPKSQEKIAACQFTVVALGNYEICENEDCNFWHTKRQEHRHHLLVGDWIVARNRSWQETPEVGIFVVKQADILGKFVEVA